MAGKPTHKKTTSNQYSLIFIIGVAVLYILSLIGAYYVGKMSLYPNEGPLANTLKRACTLDAKLCPDGTTVGREGPHCDFAPCSTVPLRPISTYKCPATEWVDCMPSTDSSMCRPEYLQWAQDNCPEFKGAAY